MSPPKNGNLSHFDIFLKYYNIKFKILNYMYCYHLLLKYLVFSTLTDKS